MMERHAKDEKCDECGEPAVVFVGTGVADLDGEIWPKCRKCADGFQLKLLIKFGEMKSGPWRPDK